MKFFRRFLENLFFLTLLIGGSFLTICAAGAVFVVILQLGHPMLAIVAAVTLGISLVAGIVSLIESH